MSDFERLKDFICNKMQMQHIYQPVMLRAPCPFISGKLRLPVVVVRVSFLQIWQT